MPLNFEAFRAELKNAILTAAKDNDHDGVDKEEAIERVAFAIAGAVDTYIRSGTVTTTVTTVVTGAATPAGVVTGTGTGTGTGSIT